MIWKEMEFQLAPQFSLVIPRSCKSPVIEPFEGKISNTIQHRFPFPEKQL